MGHSLCCQDRKIEASRTAQWRSSAVAWPQSGQRGHYCSGSTSTHVLSTDRAGEEHMSQPGSGSAAPPHAAVWPLVPKRRMHFAHLTLHNTVWCLRPAWTSRTGLQAQSYMPGSLPHAWSFGLSSNDQRLLLGCPLQPASLGSALFLC